MMDLCKRAQGATEYLVLLAVVLVIALVAIALLGFFPGTATDAQATNSKAYWESATPVAITESSARWDPTDYGGLFVDTWPYLRIRNNGNYPIRLTKILGGNQSIPEVCTSLYGCGPLSDYFFLQPGQEAYFGDPTYFPGLPSQYHFHIARYNSPSCISQGGSFDDVLCAAQQVCASSSGGRDFGSVSVAKFGFEYIEYVEGNAVTKKQLSSVPLIIRCVEPI